jgi:hypothetical protein
MQPYLKIVCPNTAGFVGYSKLAVYKGNGEQVGEIRVDCPASPPEATTVKFISQTAGGEPKTWRIEMSLTNTSNGHTNSQVFNGRYMPGQANTTTGDASVTVDGVTLGGGTGYR